MQHTDFLPISLEDIRARGWSELDFVLASGDAYVDHPSFGAAIIGRVLESEGYRVALLPQPTFNSPESFTIFGRPKYGYFISGGVVDSMVAHYTVAKRRRTLDEYSPAGKTDKRPDRVIDIYSHLIRKAYPNIPIIVGGLEASLRRFAHYDYWDDTVLPSLLESSGANLISYGMGERSIREIAKRLSSGECIDSLTDIAGTAYLTSFNGLPASYAECASLKKVSTDKTAYAKACRFQMDNQDYLTAKPVVQKQSKLYLVQNPPAKPLSRSELDAVYALPFTRRWHPSYDSVGGVPGLEEVEFSLTHNRGCFGGCNFCAITLHQGTRVTCRSIDSVVEEAKSLTSMPNFKGYIHDVGGPTANFRFASCAKQQKNGMCTSGKLCLSPSPCKELIADHTDYLNLLRKLRALPKVKKVFIRSGIRYDYLMQDPNESFFKELVEHHVSGQLKVAPEHCSPAVLKAMGKPSIDVYNRFSKRFYKLTQQANKPQYLVPYLISSHPGSTLKDAVALAEYLHKNRMKPEQVQDFYPTPGTVSTCMYYTGLDPFTLQSIYVARDGEDKAMQRALLQFYKPKNAARVRKALQLCHREDLITKLLAPSTRAAAYTSKTPKLNFAPANDDAPKSKRTGKNKRPPKRAANGGSTHSTYGNTGGLQNKYSGKQNSRKK